MIWFSAVTSELLDCIDHVDPEVITWGGFVGLVGSRMISYRRVVH